MAGKARNNKQPVSPVNGVPTPRGKPFTSETAREARQKRTAKEAAEKSITAAFTRLMGEYIAKDDHGNAITGAEAIARSVIKGASKGNAEMVKIALAITGETPAVKIEQTIIDDATRAAVEEFIIHGPDSTGSAD